MRSLIGRTFALAESRYQIVDVQQLGGDALVYAEPVAQRERESSVKPHSPVRAAFHYGDIAPLLEAGSPA